MTGASDSERKSIFARVGLDPLPLRHYLKDYRVGHALADGKAGLNVALLAFPQGMAYAAIAGLPIQYGIYGAAIAGIFGTLLAGSRFIALGPTNATSVLLFSSFLSLGIVDVEQKAAMLPLLLLLAGVFLILGAFLRMASLIQFISRSVATGYITAAAIYIIVNQVRKICGFSFEIPKDSNFLDVIGLTFEHLPETHVPSLVLSALTAVVFILLNRYFSRLPNVAITLVIMSAISPLIDQLFPAIEAVSRLKPIDASQWPTVLPEIRLDWIEMLAPTAFAIAFLSILEGTSIGKSLAARAGERLDANQEMLSMGFSNFGCAFFGGMAASGSLTRSQLNWSSGAKTQLSSLYAGLLCAAGAFLFGPLTGHIPTAVLGVLVVAIGISLINRGVIRTIFKTTRSDAIAFATTFVAALLFRLDLAIAIGASLSIILFLRKAATPELVEYGFTEQGHLAELKAERDDPEVSIVHVEGDLFFASSELFRDQIRRISNDPNLKVVIVKMRNAHNMDATCALALEELVRSMQLNDRYLILSEVRGSILKILERAGVNELLGSENILVDEPDNPTLSTAKAVKRAKQVLGDREARVSIYVKPDKKKREGEEA